MQYHGVVERLVEIVRTALLHRQLYARTLESERRLYEQKTLLESQREASFDGILFVAVDGLVSCNRRFRELFGLPEGPAPSQDRVFALIADRVASPGDTLARLQQHAGPAEAAHASELTLKDGRSFDLTCTPVRSAEGLYYGRGWHFFDTTERKRAEQERARLLEKEQAAREVAEDAQRRAAFLAEASRILAASLDWTATLERVAHLALPGFADWCVVDVVEEDHSLHRVAVAHVDPARAQASHQLRTRYPPFLNWPAGVPKVLRTGQSELVREVSAEQVSAIARDDGHRQLLEELGTRSLLIVPLTARGKRLGAITLAYGPSGRSYGERDLALAEDLAIRAALAVDNARLYLRTQEAVRARDEFLSIASHELRTPITSLQLAAQGLLRLSRAGSLAKVPPEFLASSLETAVRQSARMAPGRLAHPGRAAGAAAGAGGPGRGGPRDRVPDRRRGGPGRLRGVVERTGPGHRPLGPRPPGAGDGQPHLQRRQVRRRQAHRGPGRARGRHRSPVGQGPGHRHPPGAGGPHLRALRARRLGAPLQRAGVGAVHRAPRAGGPGRVHPRPEPARPGLHLHRRAPRRRAAGRGRRRRAGCDVSEPQVPGVPVMLVEDDPDIRAMVSQLLELEGWRVLSFANGTHALQALKAGERPRLILLDLMMPNMNGWQFRAEQMRDPALAAIPVVVLSGDVRGADPGSVRADGYLKKPIDLDVLLATVRRYTGV